MEGLGAFVNNPAQQFTWFDAESGSFGVESIESGSLEVKVD